MELVLKPISTMLLLKNVHGYADLKKFSLKVTVNANVDISNLKESVGHVLLVNILTLPLHNVSMQ